MNKKVRENLKITNEDNLQLMKKYLPNWDWKLQRIENKEMSWDLDNKEKTQYITMVYHTEPQNIDTRGEILIEICDETYTISGIEVDFKHRHEYGDHNKKTIRNHKDVKSNGEEPTQDDYPCVVRNVVRTEEEKWEEINKFFTTYLVSLDERIEKELPTQRSSKVHYLLRTYHYQYDDILLTELFGSKNSKYPSEERKYLEEMRKDFDKTYKEERLKRGLPNENEYFGSTISMIQGFLDDQVFGEFGNWYEDQLEEMKKYLDEREGV